MKQQRTGPFSLRLPETLMAWLDKAAEENARNMTSETVYRLHKSLEREYSKDDVDYFNRRCPTGSFNASFGLRMPDDLKEAVRIQGKKHGNSLNKEIVMRIFFSAETAHHIQPQISEPKIYQPDNLIQLTAEENQFIGMYRDLEPKTKRFVLELIQELSTPK